MTRQQNAPPRPPAAITADDRRLLTEGMFAFVPAPAPAPKDSSHADDAHDTFQSTQALWGPLWGRGVFGGALAGQALAIAQETVDQGGATGLLVHSMHCHFLRPVRDTAQTPVVYHVDRVRDGRSVAVRVVVARQAGKAVFSATLSFARELDGGATTKKKTLQHQAPLPPAAAGRKQGQGPPTQRPDEAVAPAAALSPTAQTEHGSLYESVRVVDDADWARPEQARFGQWVRVCSEPRTGSTKSATPPPSPPCKPHLAALAYVSDHYFIGTVMRAHRARRFNGSNSVADVARRLDSSTPEGRKKLDSIEALKREEADELARTRTHGRGDDDNGAIGEMLVSLDHTIYFHQPSAVRADDWMFFEMDTPWAGHERGLVVCRIWSRDGVLLATCVQEGLVRLQQPTGPASKL